MVLGIILRGPSDVGIRKISISLAHLVLFFGFKENLVYSVYSFFFFFRRDYREVTYYSNKENLMKQKMILKKWWVQFLCGSAKIRVNILNLFFYILRHFNSFIPERENCLVYVRIIVPELIFSDWHQRITLTNGR